MNTPSEERGQMYRRLIELSDLAIQRRRELEAAGETRSRSGRENDDYLTEEERREFFHLTRELAGITIQDGQARCQGKSWQIHGKQEV